jgi:outer membrane protein
MVLRSGFISAAALLCFATGAWAQQAASKVGVISVQGAIVGTKDGQKASQELEAKFAPKKKDIDSRTAEITQMEDQLRKGGNLMSEDKRQQMERDVDEKKKRLQRVLQGLSQRMMAVIEKYAKDNGYNMILDVSNPNTPVLYASSGIDITQDIISLYDKTSTNGGPAAAPGTPGTTRPTTSSPSTPGVTPTKPTGAAPTVSPGVR